MPDPAIVQVEVGPDPGYGTTAEFRGDDINIDINIPTYEGNSLFRITIERDIDGDWRVFFPDIRTGIPGEDGAIGRLEDAVDPDKVYETANGIAYLGAPD